MADVNIKDQLNQLFRGEHLTKDSAKQIMLAIGKGEVDPHQTTALLTSYCMRQITGAELSGFQEAMLQLAIPIDFSDLDTIDIVGTGGDGKNTFNISTISSFVVAGAGYMVAKHGNKAVSSACGSSNVLQHLGYSFSNDYDKLRKDIEVANFCFFHAPLFHPAMKEVVPIRKALQVKTFFNIMGPLLNPSKPKHQFSGVYSEEVLLLYKEVFEQTGINYGLVYSIDGYDEISLTGPFRLITNTEDTTIDPKDIGCKQILEADLYGGTTVEEAASIFVKILEGNGTPAQQAAVAANAGYAIHRFKPSISILDCIAEAKESILSGKGRDKLKLLTGN